VADGDLEVRRPDLVPTVGRGGPRGDGPGGPRADGPRPRPVRRWRGAARRQVRDV